ncbi:MAG TPA: NAD-dependent epimerase/dehydratase family protein [Anaerolineae bacterium]|nr:NAD-dependent epimerase/dehydratase family protein [Anaerolineae bacterium]
MKIFVTGATGFIGSHLVPKLIERGHNVICLVRNPDKASSLAQAGATLAPGNITDRASMQAPLRGSDAVFHLAGQYAYDLRQQQGMRAINVDGARHTLELATELGVSRIIHTSTVGVFGNTHGRVVDETHRAPLAEMTSEYERTKWMAHYEIAVPLQERGAPVIIVQPGGVTGPGDTAPHASVYRYFLRRPPAFFGAQSGLTWAHVGDIAEGHILALEQGRPGESYVLAGPALTYRQTMQLWEKITGIPAPKVWLPGWLAGGLARLVSVLERAFGLRAAFSSEALLTMADYTFYASAAKAMRELGWQPRPIEETFKETLSTIR